MRKREGFQISDFKKDRRISEDNSYFPENWRFQFVKHLLSRWVTTQLLIVFDLQPINNRFSHLSSWGVTNVLLIFHKNRMCLDLRAHWETIRPLKLSDFKSCQQQLVIIFNLILRGFIWHLTLSKWHIWPCYTLDFCSSWAHLVVFLRNKLFHVSWNL